MVYFQILGFPKTLVQACCLLAFPSLVSEYHLPVSRDNFITLFPLPLPPVMQSSLLPEPRMLGITTLQCSDTPAYNDKSQFRLQDVKNCSPVRSLQFTLLFQLEMSWLKSELFNPIHNATRILNRGIFNIIYCYRQRKLFRLLPSIVWPGRVKYFHTTYSSLGLWTEMDKIEIVMRVELK